MAALDILINVAILCLFLVTLDRSSYAVITGATNISKSTRMRYSAIGFIFVALSTSLPEAAVSLFATFENAVGLAVGNVLGSNIANVCLIVGLPVVIGCLKKIRSTGCSLNLGKQESSSLFFGLFISSMLPLFLVRGFGYGPFIGVVLLIIFLVYSFHLSRSSMERGLSETPRISAARRVFVKGLLWSIAGIVGVIISGYGIVYSASNLAAVFSLSQTFIGATLVAIGTSLPELAISMKSIQKGLFDFALGNAIGSCFANLTIVMGLIFIFSRITIRVDAYFDLVFFSLVSNLFMWYFLTRGKLGTGEGTVLLLIYAIFLVEFVGVFTFF